MPGRIFAPGVPPQVPAGARYCGTRCRTRAKNDRRLALEREKRARRRLAHVVRDANGQALVYVYSLENEAEALQAEALTADDPGCAPTR
jgi:hypothetical protein